MALRIFEDRNGEGWQVWHVVPASTVLERSRWIDDRYREGWLCFESLETGERRRLAPVPSGWDRLGPERLALMCRMAEPSRQAVRRTA